MKQDTQYTCPASRQVTLAAALRRDIGGSSDLSGYAPPFLAWTKARAKEDNERDTSLLAVTSQSDSRSLPAAV